MGIGIDRYQNPFFPGDPAVYIIKVQASRIGIEFKKTAAVPGLMDNSGHIDLIGLALVDQAAGGMRQHAKIAMIHGAQNALGLLFKRQIKIAVDRSHDQIQPGQHRVWQIQGAVFQDFNFKAL